MKDVPKGFREFKFELTFSKLMKQISVLYPSNENLVSFGKESIFVSEDTGEVMLAVQLEHPSWSHSPQLALKKWNSQK